MVYFGNRKRITFISFISFFTTVSLVTLLTLDALNTLRTLLALVSFVTLVSSCTLDSLDTLYALDALFTLVTFFAFFSVFSVNTLGFHVGINAINVPIAVLNIGGASILAIIAIDTIFSVSSICAPFSLNALQTSFALFSTISFFAFDVYRRRIFKISVIRPRNNTFIGYGRIEGGTVFSDVYYFGTDRSSYGRSLRNISDQFFHESTAFDTDF